MPKKTKPVADPPPRPIIRILDYQADTMVTLTLAEFVDGLLDQGEWVKGVGFVGKSIK